MPHYGEYDSIPVGEFSDTSIQSVQSLVPEAVLVPGIFPQSLISMDPIGFVHVDCDQYQSVKSACEAMPQYMIKGGLMYFDDYGSLEGATKAVDLFNPKIIENGKAIIEV